MHLPNITSSYWSHQSVINAKVFFGASEQLNKGKKGSLNGMHIDVQAYRFFLSYDRGA